MKAAFLGILLAAAPLTSAAQKFPPELAVGQVITSRPGDTINGWTHVSAGIIYRRTTANNVTTETIDCCAAVFERGNTVLIARTARVGSNKGSQPTTDRIHETSKVEKLPGEFLAGCDLLWINPVANLIQDKTDAVRSFVVTPEGITQVRWINDQNWCSSGDEEI
ncbi:MAG TPA: hypothetical protein VM531_06280 [Sphingomicrobium sp.]|jgi:hypothetical protein|nr:hypothetical protein [Sphingomicrobium sp.]